jgi:hypothetical protein
VHAILQNKHQQQATQALSALQHLQDTLQMLLCHQASSTMVRLVTTSIDTTVGLLTVVRYGWKVCYCAIRPSWAYASMPTGLLNNGHLRPARPAQRV